MITDSNISNRLGTHSPVLLSILLAIPTPGASNVPLGIFFVLLMFPEILSKSSQGVRQLVPILMKFLIACLVSGFILIYLSLQQDSGRQLEVHKFLYGTGLVTSLTFGLVGIVYSIEQIGMKKVILLFSISRVILCGLSWFSTSLAHLASVDGIHQNFWKYGVSEFAILISLILFRSVYLTRIMLAFCLGISIIFDSRVLIAITTLLILKTFWGTRPKNQDRIHRHRILLMVVTLITVFSIAPSLFNVVSGTGVMGNEIKLRTLSQEGTTKNVLLAGRPEQLAGLSLLKKYPFGFGIGVVPSSTDYMIAISNLPISAGLKEHSTVATYFSVDRRFSFHSMLWDFWGLYGLAGLSLILFLLYRAFCETLKFSSNSILMLYAALISIWDLIFSPPIIHQSLLVFGIAISQYQRVKSTYEN